MKSKDTLLLEQAYRRVYLKENLEQILPGLNFQQTTKKALKYQPFEGSQEQMPPMSYMETNENLSDPLEEGIWDRVKGLGSGIKAGASILGQNLKDKAVSALGGTPQQRSGETAGQAYAKAQQGSLKNSFIKKATKEIEDFKNDLKVMGIKQTDAELRTAGLTEIADKLKAMEDLVNFLQTQKASPSTQSSASSQSNTTTNTQASSNTQQQSVPNIPTSPVTPTNNASQQTPSSPSQRQRNAKGQFTSSKQAQPQQNNTQP